jgi:hypothetical protein
MSLPETAIVVAVVVVAMKRTLMMDLCHVVLS